MVKFFTGIIYIEILNSTVTEMKNVITYFVKTDVWKKIYLEKQV